LNNSASDKVQYQQVVSRFTIAGSAIYMKLNPDYTGFIKPDQMKSLLMIMFCFTAFCSDGQEVTTPSDESRLESPYYLPAPEGWTTEQFPIPIGFAPEINYNGVEDIRFSPGWGNAASEEYWTYAFLWYLDGSPETNAEIIAWNLKTYYTGLIQVNTDSTKISTGIFQPVTTSFTKIPTEENDSQTYTGTIGMVDYMQHRPITLNCRVHLKYWPEAGKTIIFYEISPQLFTHKNWQMLDQLWTDFRFEKF